MERSRHAGFDELEGWREVGTVCALNAHPPPFRSKVWIFSLAGLVSICHNAAPFLPILEVITKLSQMTMAGSHFQIPLLSL